MDAQWEVEAVGREHEEPLHQTLLSLHPTPDSIKAEADTPGIDPSQKDAGEVSLHHTTGCVRENPIFKVLERIVVKEDNVRHGSSPNKSVKDLQSYHQRKTITFNTYIELLR